MNCRRVATACSLALLTGPVAVAQKPAPAIPLAVATAFRTAYPNATILNATRERRDSQMVVEIESRDGSTRRDLLYDLEGRVLEIEETIPADSLPEVVRTAVGRDAPGARVVGVERVTTGAAIAYEVRVRRSGRTRALTYDSEGRRQP